MRFSALLLVPSLASFFASAAVVPPTHGPLNPSIQHRTLGAVIAHPVGDASLTTRTGGCGAGCGSGSGTDLDLGIDLDLSVFTKVQLDYIYSCAKTLADLRVDAVVKAKLLKTVIHIVSYSSVDLGKLDVALVSFIKYKTGILGFLGLDATTKTILVLAKLDINTLTKVDVECLQILIKVVVKTTIDLPIGAKQELLNWCTSLIYVTATQLDNVCITINATIKALLYVVVDTVVDTSVVVNSTTTATVDACIKIKTDLRVYIQGLVTSANLITKVQLKLILGIVDAWIKGDLKLLAVLGIKTLTDSAICAHVLGLLKLVGYVDVVAFLKLDLSLLSKASVLAY